MLIVVLVASVVDARAGDLRRVQFRLDLETGARRAILAQPPVELTALLRIDRPVVLGTRVVAVFDRVEVEEFRHTVIDRPAERADVNPAVAAFERVVGLKAGGAVAGMAVNHALAGEQRQRVAVGLGHRLVLRQVDDLAASAFLDLPKRHHRRCPAGQRRDVVAGIGLGALRRPGRIASQIHHAAIGLRDCIVTGAAEIFLRTVLPVAADPHDDEARIDGQCQLVGDAGAVERAGHRGFHPDVGDLPQPHQEFEAARLLEIEPERQFVFCDLGLVAAMRPRPARQLRRRKTKHIAARALDMNDLGAELGELGADIGLRDEAARADDADAFERPESRGNAGRCRPLQALDPVRDRLFQLFDLVVGNEPGIVRHVRRPPYEDASAGSSGSFAATSVSCALR